MVSLTLARLYEMTQDMRVFVWLCVGVGRKRCVCGVSVWCRHHCFKKLRGAGQHGQVESLPGVTHALNDPCTFLISFFGWRKAGVGVCYFIAWSIYCRSELKVLIIHIYTPFTLSTLRTPSRTTTDTHCKTCNTIRY